MRVAVIGSRGLTVNNLEKYLPEGTAEIISGGARGIDQCAREYAISHGIKLTEFLPEYQKFGKKAPQDISLAGLSDCRKNTRSGFLGAAPLSGGWGGAPH